MPRKRFTVGITALAVAGLAATGTASAAPSGFDLALGAPESAQNVLDNAEIELYDAHVGGQDDPDSTAAQNVEDTADGNPAKTSPWSDVGITDVDLSANMVDAMDKLGADHSFRVTSIAGGDHSSSSYHYAGTAFDIDTLDGERISSGHPGWEDFLAKCEEMGASEALGPGDEGHDSHLHCAWDE